MNPNDRRVRKTRKALRNALAELMAEKELHCITVRELTDRADLNRATFYTHYQDVYDLNEQIENSIVEELSSIMTGMPTHTYDGIYRAVINYVWENAELSKLLLGRNGNHTLRNRISQLLEESYLKIWLYEDKLSEVTEEMRYLTSYHISGCLAIISRWLDRDLADSKESVFELLRKVNSIMDDML